MAHPEENALEELLAEYGRLFRDFDDLTLARWMSQTLGQFQGRGLRLSHPLVAAYRLAATVANDRSIWHKRLVSLPLSYPVSECCGAPLLLLLSRDVLESGLVCMHCNETAVALDDLPDDLQPMFKDWAGEYAPVHAVAHWDEARQKREGDYDQAFEEAASKAETLLAFAGNQIVPRLLESFPALIWEDQDECLEVRPEDVRL